MQGAREANPDGDIREVGSRAAAIDEVVAWAQPGDAVIVVGKGHEVGQLIGDTVHHFDDREEMARALDSVLGNRAGKQAQPTAAGYGDSDTVPARGTATESKEQA